MKRKLKTWEAFEAEFKPKADEWYIDEDEDFVINYEDMLWIITRRMKKHFGEEIEIEIENDNFYTYNGEINGSLYSWHESWFEPEFEPIEFITEEEFRV